MSASAFEYDDEELREVCSVTGDWGGTSWGEAILRLLDERDDWRGQVVAIRAQQMRALRERDEALRLIRTARDYCGRPSGVCLPAEKSAK